MQPDTRSGRWTRREFVRGAAGVVALQQLHNDPGAAAMRFEQPRFAYVGCGREEQGPGSIHVFRLRSEVWSRIQSVASRAPACILLSPEQRTLYVANEVDVHEGLPRGTVEAFSIDPGDGRITLLDRKPLSLSATHPRHMALSPDGKLLAVAAYGGGIYNLLPIAEDGSIGHPSSIYKEAGSGLSAQLQASAHPHTLLFDASGGYLLASDFGSDRLSVFAVENGKLRRRMQKSAGEGSGLGACALDPMGSVLYAWHDLKNTLACYRYDGGTVGETIQCLVRQRLPRPSGGASASSSSVSPGSASPRALALHPSGRTLYASEATGEATGNGLRAWRIDAESGMLSGARHAFPREVTPTGITVAHDGKSIFVLDGVRGSIYKVTTDPSTGEPGWKTEVARVNEPRSMALKTIG